MFMSKETPYLVITEVRRRRREDRSRSRDGLGKSCQFAFATQKVSTSSRGRGGNDPNSPAQKFRNAHYGALKRSKIDGLNRSGTEGSCTLYSFRHTFATRFLERRSGDLLTLAALLGQSSLRMVMRYAHPSDNYKFEAIKSLEPDPCLHQRSNARSA